MLTSILPNPQHSYAHESTYLNNPNPYNEQSIALVGKNIPPYGEREGYVPREPSDFADGGAFPEIPIKQYPLDMGRKDKKQSTSGVVALTTDADGEVRYDSILREGMRKDQIVHSRYKDMLPQDNVTDNDLARPTEDEVADTTEATRQALEKLVEGKLAASRPRGTHQQNNGPMFIRYTPGQQGASYNSGAASRMIKLYEMPTDPLEPPKYRHKKLPQRPPSPPVPVMHSPPRKVTVEDQKNWKIPPCISNWKNNKGFTLPLHQRLAADGRTLQTHTINDKFAKFAESLLIAERVARQQVEDNARKKIALAQEKRKKKEKELRAMAKSAKQIYSSVGGGAGERHVEDRNASPETQDADDRPSSPNKRQSSRPDSDSDGASSDNSAHERPTRNHEPPSRNHERRRDRDRGRDRERHVEDSRRDRHDEGRNKGVSEEEMKMREERERIRKDRKRDRVREYRHDQRKNRNAGKSVRQRERDVTEKIALGQMAGKRTTDSMYDRRLFNQDSGLDTGFGAEDNYNLYDKPLFNATAKKIYRPKAMDLEMYGGEDEDNDLLDESDKFKPHRGFDGADGGDDHRRTKGAPVQFEKESDKESTDSEADNAPQSNARNAEEDDPFGLGRHVTTHKRRRLDTAVGQHKKGFMHAAAGGGNIRSAEDFNTNREKVAFEKASVDADDVNNQDIKGGLRERSNPREDRSRNDRRRDDRWESGNRDSHRYRNDRDRDDRRREDSDRNRDRDRDNNRRRNRDRDGRRRDRSRSPRDGSDRRRR